MKRTNTAVWIEKYNRWQIKVQKDNIRKTFYSGTPGRTGQREANAKADAWLDQNIVNTKVNVRQASEKYIEQLKITTSKSHYTQYEYYFKSWINAKIGNVRIENLNEQHLQNIINAAYAKGLSKKTLSNIKSCMQSWLKFCRMNKYTVLRPENISIPKSAYVKEKRILQPADIKKLFTLDQTFLNREAVFDMYIHAYRFQVATGLRPGEIIGLKKLDINDNIVNLQRSINVNNETTRGKNDNARRAFKLTPLAQKIISDQYAMLENLEIQSEYVFPTQYGEFIPEKTFYERWCRYRDFNNFSAPVSLYELRHTFVSVTKSLPAGFLKQLIGHSKDMDTYGVYSHEIETDRSTAADMIQELFEEILNKQ
jgi:integrase